MTKTVLIFQHATDASVLGPPPDSEAGWVLVKLNLDADAVIVNVDDLPDHLIDDWAYTGGIPLVVENAKQAGVARPISAVK